MRKRFFAVFLATILMLCSLPVQAFAATKKAYASYEDGVLTFRCNTSRSKYEKTYDIPNSFLGDAVPIAHLGEENDPIQWTDVAFSTTKIVFKDSFRDCHVLDASFWFKDFTALTEVEDFCNLGLQCVCSLESMFENCSSLTEIGYYSKSGLPYNWTSAPGLMSTKAMFKNCSSLKSVRLSSFDDTTFLDDMSEMFSGCVVLKNADFGFNVENVWFFNQMFYNCAELGEFDCGIYNEEKNDMIFNSKNGVNFTEMFYGCKKINDFDTMYISSGIYFKSMFEGCKELKDTAVKSLKSGNDALDMTNMFKDSGIENIDMSKWDMRNVQSIEGMFENCNYLTSVTFPKEKVCTPTSLKNLFYGCSKLTSIKNISNLDTSKVTDMSYTFCKCSMLEELDVSCWDTFKVTTMRSMFDGCSKLSKLNVSGWDTSNVASMAYTFSECYELPELDVSGWKTSKVTTMHSMFNKCNKLSKLDVSGFDTSNIIDMSYVFSECYELPKLDVSGWKTSKVTTMHSMFNKCYVIAELDVSGWDTSNVKDMNFLINCCYIIKKLDVSSWDTSNVIAMNSAFQWCYELASLDVTKWDTSKVTDISWMFNYCYKLTDLDLSKWDTSNVTNMKCTFKDCTGLTSLNLTGWDTSNVTDMERMFYNVCSIKILDLSSFDTSKVTVASRMFNECSSLETIYVSENWDVSSVNTSYNFFTNCLVLKGGNGTEKADAGIGMAVIDTPEHPGLLTYKAAPVKPVKPDGGDNGDGGSGNGSGSNGNGGSSNGSGSNGNGGSSNGSGSNGNGGSSNGSGSNGGSGNSNGSSNGGSSNGSASGSGNGSGSGSNGGSGNGNGSGNGGSNPNTPIPTPNPQPTLPPSELNVGDFVNRCYEVALGREADSEGYEYWVSNLNNGQACGAQVGYGFIFSEEYKNKNRTNEEFVTDMYSMYFGREADSDGYNYWLEQLNSETASREQVFAGFANSEEFYNLCLKYGVVSGAYLVGVLNDQQGGVNCFVARLYRVCLNRLPDQAGQAGWVQKLMNGEVTGTTCAYGFIFSQEFVNMNLNDVDYVVYMYRAFFGREADEGGLNYWVGQLTDGTSSRDDVFNGFSGSLEFANLCALYGINA